MNGRLIHIFKYKIADVGETGEFTVSIPAGAILVDIAIQREAIFAWCQVTQSKPTDYTFCIVETGKGFTENIRLVPIRSLLHLDGAYVVHVYAERVMVAR